MKKVIVFILTMLLILAMVGCSQEYNQNNNEKAADTSKAHSTNIDNNNKDVKEDEAPNDAREIEESKGYQVGEVSAAVKTKELIFSEGMAPFEYNGMYGYIDERGKVAIDAIYTDALPFKDGIALIATMSGTKAIDILGTELFSFPLYSYVARAVTPVGNCLHVTRIEDPYYVFDDGSTLLESSDSILQLAELIAEKQLSSDTAIQIYRGNASQLYFYKAVFSNGMFLSTSGNTAESVIFIENYDPQRQYVVDLNGDIIAESSAVFTLGAPSDGMIPFCNYGRWGYMDYQGNVVIEAEYDNAKGFSHGFAAVKKGDNWMLINKDNKVLMSPIAPGELHNIQVFDNNIMLVKASNSPKHWDDYEYCALFDLNKVVDGESGFLIYSSPSPEYEIHYDGSSVFTIVDQTGTKEARMFRLINT